MLIAPKKDGKVHICVDLKPLNHSVLREIYPLPKVDETLAWLSGVKIISKPGNNIGFWQILLSQAPCLLTTFITPIRRYCFKKLSFRISSAPEHFQHQMSEILTDLPEVTSQMDDILGFEKHKMNMINISKESSEEVNVTLSP